MKLIVNPHKIEIDKSPVNEREIDITKCEFEFADEITNDYVKEAYFTFNGTSYKEIIVNNQCAIPSEVLAKKGQVEIGVVAYLVENEEEIKRYNPSPAYFNTWLGSLKDNAENSEPITPSEMEQFEQALNDGLNEVANVDIDAEQLDNGMSVTITNRYGEDKTVYAYDGEKGETGATPNIQIGTVVTGDHSEVTRTGTNENPIFNFVLEKGDKGDTGNGIASVTKTSTSGLVDTYTITYTNGTTTAFNVTNGKSITNIAKTSTSGLEDNYTITYNDNTTSTFTVTNGNGISSIEKTGTQDNVDTYTIYYTNGTTSTFTVTNSTVTNQEFEELKAEHEELVNTLPRVEETGESITLDNTAQYKMNVALNPSELSQDGTPTPDNPIPIKKVTGDNTITVCGKNLLNSQNWAGGYIDSSGNLHTGNTNALFDGYIEVNSNTQYVISTNTSIRNVAISEFDSSQMFIQRNQSGNNVSLLTITTTANTKYVRVQFNYDNSTTITQAIIDGLELQLESGSSRSSYEPYQSQTYPINLGSLEYCKIGDYSDEFALSTGKNLFGSQLELGSLNNNNGIPQNDEGAIRTKDFIEVKSNTTYTINNNNKYHTYIYFYDENQTFISAITGSSATVNPLTFTTTATTKYIKARTIASNNENDLTTIFMLNEGSTVLPWEPYGIGNWYIRRNIGKNVFDGTEAYNYLGGTTSNPYYVFYNNDRQISNSIKSTTVYSNYFIVDFSSGLLQKDGGCKIGEFNSINRAFFCIHSITSVNDFKTWLTTHNTIIYYILATTTGEAITDTTLITQLNNLYNQIKSYKGQTNITQTNAELPFNIDANALYDLNNLISRVATLEVEV